jgi:hypothetical protein
MHFDKQILRGENLVCELDDFAMLPTIESLGAPAKLTTEPAALRRVTRQDEEIKVDNDTVSTLRIVISNACYASRY